MTYEKDALRPLTFTGTGREYFGIWIVNLALMIVTLGIYSAWAKVRRLQYFYRHTQLDGSSFDYHGQPMAILKGRIVGLMLFGLYTMAFYSRPAIAVAVIAVLAAVMPWLLVKSLRFRFHNSSYRGLRFSFHGATGSGYWVFLAMPVFTMLTFMTLGPLWHHRLKRFLTAHAAYGRTRFHFNAEVSEFYVAYVAGAFILVGAIVALGVLTAISAILTVPGGLDGLPPQATVASTAAVIIGLVIYVVGILLAQAFITTRIQNHVWRRTTLANHGFISELEPLNLFRIQLTNLFLTIVTLGLYRPFAQVRLAQYQASVFWLVAAGSLDEFVAGEAQELSAIGEETAELFDFDIAL